MFKLKAQDTFTWPAKAKVPVDGKYQTVPFNVTFNVLSQTEVDALIGDLDNGASIRVLTVAIKSFDGIDVEDDNGDLVTDDDERKEIILRYPYFVNAISDAWKAGLSGSRTKN